MRAPIIDLIGIASSLKHDGARFQTPAGNPVESFSRDQLHGNRLWFDQKPPGGQFGGLTCGARNRTAESGSLPPPPDEFFAGVSGVFRAYPFRAEIVEADQIVDPHGFGIVIRRAAFGVDRIVSVGHLVFGRFGLSRENPGGGRMSVVLPLLRRRLLVGRASAKSSLNGFLRLAGKDASLLWGLCG